MSTVAAHVIAPRTNDSNLHVFSSNFAMLAGADTGISHLRTLVLSVAMQGRLGTSDPTDEPAELLLTRLIAERARLVESGKARKRQPLDAELELPIDPPLRWAHTRLGEVITVVRGASPRPKGDPRFFSASRTQFRWVKISDFRKHGDGQTLHDTDEFLTEEGAQHSVLVKKGTLLLTNSATIGVPMFMGVDGYIHDGFLAFPHFPAEIEQRFFFFQLRYLTAHLLSEARGLAQLNLNSDIVRRSPLLLPPLAEQRRIVAKVDQLMALCDELEARQNKKREVGTRLTKSALEALTTSEGPEEFDAAWNRVVENFDVLVDRAEKVFEMRRSIRDLAVSGHILSLSERENRSEIRDDGPFTIPRRWAWLSLGELAKETSYGTSQKAHEESSGVPVLRMNNIQGGSLDLSSVKYVPLDTEKVAELMLEGGDLLFNRTNSYELVGKMAVFREEGLYTFASYLIRVRLDQARTLPEYVNLYFGSSLCRRTQIEPHITRQTNQANFNGTKLKDIAIPIPPLDEQKRIVAIVERLMATCDALETRLLHAQGRASKLAQAAVSALLE